MPLTVKQVIDRAFQKFNAKADDIDLTATQYSDAIIELNGMMAEFYTEFRLGYTVHSSETETITVPDHAELFVINQLALRLSEEFGQPPPPGLQAAAKRSLNALRDRRKRLSSYPLPSTMPTGAGHGAYNNNFFGDEDYAISVDGSGNHEINSRGQKIRANEEV